MQNEEIEEASLEYLDEYLQVYYDDQIEVKIAATRKILLLTLDMKNIEYLINHGSLISTISRTLRDDYKKSMELCIYLLCVFYIFSNYQNFHDILLTNQIGDATMKIIEFQTQRFDIKFKEFIEFEEKSKSNPQLKPQLEVELKRLNKMISKQDKLIYISFTILLNLAEDFGIEKKMKKRKIVSYLVKMLERNDFHLLIIVLLFLRKLSIVSENKTQMLEDNIIEKLGRFFTCNNNVLLQLSLGVMKNLCFDTKIREAIESAGYIPKIIDLLKIPNFRFIAIVLLYELTLDEKIRYTFAYTDCLQLVIKLIIHFPEPIVGKELIALSVNLAANKRTAELLQEEELSKIIDRAFQYEDILLFKFVKNIAINTNITPLQDCLEAYLPDFIKLALTKGKNDDLKIELIGLLANIRIGNGWLDYINNAFLDFIHQNMVNGAVEDDIILETVMLVSNLALDPKCAELLSRNKLLRKICQLLIEKTDDDEFVVQCLQNIQIFLIHQIEIEYILEQEDLILYFLNYIQDKNQVVRRVNNEVLEILREYDPELSERIKERKFYESNKEWIESKLNINRVLKNCYKKNQNSNFFKYYQYQYLGMDLYEKQLMAHHGISNLDEETSYELMQQQLQMQQMGYGGYGNEINPRMWEDSDDEN